MKSNLYLSLIIFLISWSSTSAQVKAKTGEFDEGINEFNEGATEPYIVYGPDTTQPQLTQPIFPGGVGTLYDLINEGLNEFQDVNVKIINIQFEVDSSGKVNNVIITDNLKSELGSKVVSLMYSKNWIPGISNGKPILITMKMPIPIYPRKIKNH